MATSWVTGSALATIMDPDMDTLIAKARSSAKADERISLIRQAVDKSQSYYANLPLAETSSLFAISAKISGWDPVQFGGPGFSWETVTRK